MLRTSKAHFGRCARIIKTWMRKSGYDYGASFNMLPACTKPIPCAKS